MDIKAKYGSCIVPKGTILFTASNNKEIIDYCFFALSYSIANAFRENRNVFAFEVTNDIEVLFLIKEFRYLGRFISAGDEIYRYYYPKEKNIDDLIIKQNRSKLKKFIRIIKKQGYNGALNSIENKFQLEILLFGSSLFIKNHLVLLDKDEKDIKKSFANYYALTQLKTYPSSEFLQKLSKEEGYNSFDYQKEMDSLIESKEIIDYYSLESITNKKIMCDLLVKDLINI